MQTLPERSQRDHWKYLYKNKNKNKTRTRPCMTRIRPARSGYDKHDPAPIRQARPGYDQHDPDTTSTPGYDQ
jgi:hypothetical protein